MGFLEKYHAKRNFKKTPEPKGGNAGKHPKLAFVVQEHHASSLHYDFRLELDGVLKSWAVPKGPSMNPHDHHLAVHVEDHPYEYRKFEGVIPQGEYGAGNVIIWDEGWYEPRANTQDSEKTLRQELKDGHLTFVMHGKKLQGEFALIRMHEDDKTWLLIKKGDDFASTKDILKQNTSIKSGKKVDDMGGSKIPPELENYPKVKQPWRVHPMLCTLVDQPFSREGWFFEVKWDGYRAIGTKHKSDIELYSRAGTNFADHYPPVAEALRELRHDVILDGEIVVVDDAGRPHFEWLQNWRRAPEGTLYYYVFDILWCNGHDVRTMPLAARKKLLRSVVPANSSIRYSDHVETLGTELFEQMQQRNLEGIVAKKADSEYHENDRGQAWLKIKTHLRQEVVIGGFTEPRGGRKYLGALLVGVYDKGEFVYVGHSGGGIADDQRKELRAQLEKLERKTSPFAMEPKPNAPVHWVRPELVCEMSFGEWTSEGYMRQPQFEGMREDKKATAVHREKPKNSVRPASTEATEASPLLRAQTSLRQGSRTARERSGDASSAKPGDEHNGGPSAGHHQNEFTHLDKVFFPKAKMTKGDMMDYYRSVADVMLPYLKDRPHSLLRMPNGITGEKFFQKNNEHLPDWVPSADIYSDSNQANLHWIVGGDLDTLLYMVQLGCVEINPWSSRIQHLDKPDWLVIDLDPEGRITFKDVVTVARTVKEVCDEWHIPTHPKTSGKTGIHIFVPMHAKYTYEQVKNLAHLIVLEVNKRQPELTSVERMPEKRKNKLYLDFLQNREGQTLAAPYSLRPTPEATVSMPLHWDEVVPSLKPTDFTIHNALARLQKTGDLWQPVLQKGVDLATILKKIGA
jgi:bifunctional non-homologous end joining protein LigD